ncbi:alkylation response protein AidB-like acyl-CoA dehydrogenase [Rhizobium sp. BK650]|nr:alkylation response protein AidB-like acyl-CoA dehydrogenase [Rhizobium sp. BK650]
MPGMIHNPGGRETPAQAACGAGAARQSRLAIDRAVADPNADPVAAAQIFTAEAKIVSTESAIEANNKLLELAGSTLAEHNLDRHWRNARTHTLHDPVRWKYSILGKYVLNGEKPPLHPWS